MSLQLVIYTSTMPIFPCNTRMKWFMLKVHPEDESYALLVQGFSKSYDLIELVSAIQGSLDRLTFSRWQGR